ncbi:MAG: NAD-dependent epimerase/dehydratase family protein [Alphaproteobacteria bacterium]
MVTGVAGFIGFHTAAKLLGQGVPVVGIDSVNDYYDVKLKEARLAQLQKLPGFTFYRANLAGREAVASIIERHGADITEIIHLAAQAGVRYSLVNPYAYIESNIMAQIVLLEAARAMKKLRHFVYASSSSVYGGNKKIPFSVEDRTDHPVSLYAATKRADELFGHTYAHLYGTPMTGLRFFTVYGPWGRPDMAAYLFAGAILRGEPIKVFNHGKMRRDFTYVDDIVSGILAAAAHPPKREAGAAPAAVYNLGNSRAENLMDFIGTLENLLGKKAVYQYEDMQPGDVPETFADIAASTRDLGYMPTTTIAAGLEKFVAWFREYHKV